MAETRIWVEIRQSGTNDNRVKVPVSSNGAAYAERRANGNWPSGELETGLSRSLVSVRLKIFSVWGENRAGGIASLLSRCYCEPRRNLG